MILHRIPFFINFVKNGKMKKCSRCGKLKAKEDFYKSMVSPDGARPECKKCKDDANTDYLRTIPGLIKRIYNSQKHSSKRRGHNPPDYSRHDLLMFAIQSSEFNELYLNWIYSGYEKMMSPSFDRVRDDEGYSFDNFNKWMTWAQNKQKGHDDCKLGKISSGNKHISVIGININTAEQSAFLSMREAARLLNINPGHISECCNGKRKSEGGYYWRIA